MNDVWVFNGEGGTFPAGVFASKKDAEAWSVNALKEIQLGVHTPDSAPKRLQTVAGVKITERLTRGLGEAGFGSV